MEPNETFANYKKRMKQTARELGYSNLCLAKIKAAKSESEIERIMVTERQRLAG